MNDLFFLIQPMKYSVVLLLFFSFYYSYSQQAPTYAQYTYQQLLANPAVAGSDKGIVITASQRKQWHSIAGSPNTESLSIHAPVLHKSIGLGAFVVNENAGMLHHLYLGTCYAYKINLLSGVFSFGLQVGAIQLGVNSANADPKDIDDNYLPVVNKKVWSLDFGTGLYYQSSRLTISVSSQHLKPYKSNAPNFSINNISYLMATYSLPLTTDFSLMPAINVRHTFKASTQYDVGLYIKEKHSCSVGVNYRNQAVWSFQLMLNSALFFPKIKDQWSIGYAYDYAANGLTNTNVLGNELLLIYKIAPKKKYSTLEKQLPNVSPKYF